jgi:hypothetical protein
MRARTSSLVPVGIRRARNLALLDAVDICPRSSYRGTVWRVVREGRSPLDGIRADSGGFSFLHTALEADGAIAEVAYHLSQQPVFPSRYRVVLHEIRINATAVLFDIEKKLHSYSVDPQEIGEAAAFLGFDALVTPNARYPCANLMLFLNETPPKQLDVVAEEPVDLVRWFDGTLAGEK